MSQALAQPRSYLHVAVNHKAYTLHIELNKTVTEATVDATSYKLYFSQSEFATERFLNQDRLAKTQPEASLDDRSCK